MSRSFKAKPLTTKLFLANLPIQIRHHAGMRRFVFAAMLVAGGLCGCAVSEPPKIPVAITPAVLPQKPIALTDEADAALKAAEQSVTEARIKRALWTAAVVELERARAAAKEFDSVATLGHAREAIALCGLAITQLAEPPVTW